jgi:hypothetical protein
MKERNRMKKRLICQHESEEEKMWRRNSNVMKERKQGVKRKIRRRKCVAGIKTRRENKG